MICDTIGLTMTTAVNLYLVKLGNEMSIPFEVSLDLLYCPANRKVLKGSANQFKSARGTCNEGFINKTWSDKA